MLSLIDRFIKWTEFFKLQIVISDEAGPHAFVVSLKIEGFGPIILPNS